MAKKKTAEELREEARKIVAQAVQLEQKENAVYGSSLRKIAQEYDAKPEELLAFIKANYKSSKQE